MLLLDTNVLSAMMSGEPPGKVVGWLLRQLSDGRRRAGLEAAAPAMFADDFRGRVLPFDSRAAGGYAEALAARQRVGRPAGTINLMLAGIAQAQRASVVTRNVADFEGVGVTIVNLWDE